MKKTAVQHILPLVLLVVSASMITACEKGGARTPKDAVIKAKCERGYESNEENAKTLAAISKNSNIEADYAVRTYITKFDVSDESKESLLNPGNVDIITAQKVDSFAVSSDAITLVKDCANVEASLTGPAGLKIEKLRIKDVTLLSIELERSDIQEIEGKIIENKISVKIEKSARLEDIDKQLETDMKKPENKKNKHKMKAALKNIQERQLARGNILTKITIDVSGATKQSYVIEQHSGEIFGDARIDFDTSVLKMIEKRTASIGTPDFVKEALRAKEAKDAVQFATSGGSASADEGSIISIDKLTGGRISDEQAKVMLEEAKTIAETEAITVLKEKLDIAAGLASSLSKPIEVEPVVIAPIVPALPAATTQTKVEEKKSEEKKPAAPSTLVPAVAAASKPVTKS